MKLVDHKRPDQMKDFAVPFYLGNFLHCRSSIAKELMADAAVVLKELGWKNEFINNRTQKPSYNRDFGK